VDYFSSFLLQNFYRDLIYGVLKKKTKIYKNKISFSKLELWTSEALQMDHIFKSP
jgi:hypothetical protein